MLKKKILKSGLTLLVEQKPRMPSFSMGFTLKSGSANENEAQNGIHHFIEHMLFKGSRKYSQKEIAQISDRLGGAFNAYTSKERTQIYIKAITEKFEVALELLFDIIMNSRFEKSEIRHEQEVILQEISEDKDNPQAYLLDLHFKNSLKNSSLSFPILGSRETVSGFDPKFIYQYYKEKYKPQNIIISISGGLSYERISDQVSLLYEKYPDGESQELVKIPFQMKKGIYVQENPNLEQVYCVMAQETIDADARRKYQQLIMNEILGNGMSSRLFQTIREEKGLAYSIGSNIDRSKSAGFLLIHSIVSEKRILEYLLSVKELLYQLKEDGVVDQEEFLRAKDSVKSSLILGMEDSLNLMRYNLSQDLYQHSLTSKELLSLIDNITIKEINKEISTVINPEQMFVSLYGNIKEGVMRNFTL